MVDPRTKGVRCNIWHVLIPNPQDERDSGQNKDDEDQIDIDNEGLVFDDVEEEAEGGDAGRVAEVRADYSGMTVYKLKEELRTRGLEV